MDIYKCGTLCGIAIVCCFFSINKVNLTNAGSYTIHLTNNTNGDFGSLPSDMDLMLFYQSGSNFIDYSSGLGIDPEYMSFEVSANQTGLYYIVVCADGAVVSGEQYKLVVLKGDVLMFTEGARFKTYNETPYYARLTLSNSDGELHTQGVAYSYGNKYSVSDFAEKNFEAKQRALTPFDSWNDYVTTYERPGKFAAEASSSSNFYGVDCSGFVQWCAEASVVNGEERYKIAYDKNLQSD